MIRALAYLRLWRTLPDEERRVRTGRVLDRLLRRRRWIRRLGIADPTSWPRFEREIAGGIDAVVAALRRASPARGPLHVDLAERCRRLAARSDNLAFGVLDHADALLRREFDLLGSGPTRPLREDGGIDWHTDWKSGGRWPADRYYTDIRTVRGDGSDVKLPWELSRFQHLLVLGEAYQLAPFCLEPHAADELRGRLAGEVAQQLRDWIAHNPHAVGVNWSCTMDVAIRAANWTAALALFRGAAPFNDDLMRDWLRSLWQHGRFIRANLELAGDGLNSNHYLSDIVGLYAVGCALPELSEAAGWRTLARQALVVEIERQILPDGADFERSIPYHRLVTELFLHGALLARASGEPLPARYDERLAEMLEFVRAYTRRDGQAPQWGDNDDGRYLPLSGYASHQPHDHRHLLAIGGRLLSRPQLLEAAGLHDVEATWLFDPDPTDEREAAPGEPARPGCHAFPDVGFYVIRHRDWQTCVSTGPVGTGGVGNHTHNDIGAITLWIDGREWIIDPGTGCYTADPELRNRMRSTAAHATLQLGKREQNDIGPGLDALFTIEEQARPSVELWETRDGITRLHVCHRGFSTPERGWLHRREITIDCSRRLWQIDDLLEGDGPHPAGDEVVHLRFPLAPGTMLDLSDDGERAPAELLEALERQAVDRLRRIVGLKSRDGEVLWLALDLPGGSKLGTREGSYSPRYGVSLPAPVVVASLPLAPQVRARSWFQAPGSGARR